MKIRYIVNCLLFVLYPGFAAGNNPNSQQLSDVTSKIQRISSDVASLASERRELHDQLQQLETQYGQAVSAVRAIRIDIRRQEEALQELRVRIAAIQKDMRNQERALAGLIKAVYVMGDDRDGVKVVLNQRDPAMLSRMQAYSRYISQARLQKLQAISEDGETLRQLEAQKDADSQSLQGLLQKKQQESQAMLALKNQRESVLVQLDKDYSSKQLLLKNLIADEKKLHALVASLDKTDNNVERDVVIAKPPAPPETMQAISVSEPVNSKSADTEATRSAFGQPFASLQGELPWPVQGPVVERFGSKRYETNWDGVVIGAPEGADIRAVNDGRVVYADWLRGYGLMIIVDHGKGYLSLYAFNQSLYKNVGDHVKAGQAIGSVGKSGGRAQAGLYFGIRKHGTPVDPERWCRKSAKG